MTLTSSFLRWRRGQALIGAVFLASAAFFWWRLPPTPRFTLSLVEEESVLAVSPDGALLAVAYKGQLVLWNIATGQRETSWAVPDMSIKNIVFTPDSRRLVTNCFRDFIHNTARIYRVGAEQVEAVLPLSSWWVSGISLPEPPGFLLSPEGSHLAFVSPKEVQNTGTYVPFRQACNF